METPVLRPWELSDIASLVLYANNKKIAQYLRNGFPHPYTEQDAAEFIRTCTEKNFPHLFLAIDIGGSAVGGIGLSFHGDIYCKSAELGYWLGEPYWGRGIMPNAVRQICEIGFEKYGMARIFALPYAPNKASGKVLEKCGFTLEGVLKQSVYKNNTYMDSCIYALLNPTTNA